MVKTMANKNVEFQKNTVFPEAGSRSFMEVMGKCLMDYDAALNQLIELMEEVRDSFIEVIQIQYGLSEYEEFLKDNRAAEKAKEMRPELAEREMLSEEDPEKQEEDRTIQKDDPGQSGKEKDQKEEQTALQNSEDRVKEDLEDIWKEQMDDISDPGFMPEPEALPQQEEKRRGR